MISCGVQAQVCPGPQRRRHAAGEPVLPLQVRPAGRPADDRRRPEALRHPPGLRHDDEPADRARSSSRRRAATGSRRSRAPSTCAASSATRRSTSRSCSTARFARGRRSTTPTAQLAGGISGNAQITGIGDIQEAKDLALVLQTGALPVEFVTLDQTAISATLGKDSLNEAKTRRASSACSSSRSSCSSSTASSASSRCSASASTPPSSTPRSSLFNVTLTLPGFAGLVLTLGVAADANVVIFERIKEEARAGQEHPGRDPDRLHEGLRDDRRRQRRHRDHRARAVRGRHLVGARIRAHAPDRYRDLDAHGRARDARVPRRCSPARSCSTTRA